MHKKRLDLLVDKIEKEGVEALLVTKPENIFYLTSFFAEKMALIVSPRGRFAVTDFIYRETALKTLGGDLQVSAIGDSFVDTIGDILKKHKIKRLGFESLSLTFSRYKSLRRALRTERVIATDGIVESLREIKDKNEICALRKALKITKKTFRDVKRRLRPEVTEKAFSGYIKEIFMRNGAQGLSFEPIVATQPSASQPHYIPSQKKLGANRLILLDIGGKLDYYHSDLTRMCPLGKIGAKFVKLYNILLDAQKRAIERVMPGAKIKDLDSAARQHIANKGLGKFFGHALGHGIGLEIHERPSVSGDNNETVKEGMVFTIEPGIYIPGYGGLRVEETVCVTKGGCEVLSDDIDKSI